MTPAGRGHLEGLEITKRYAGLVANDAVDLDVGAGEVVGLIGPNGAGKTTLFDCLTGFTPATSGRAVLDDEDITDVPPARRAELGMARTFQQAKLFNHLTVAENILLGRHRHYRARAWQSAIGLGGAAEREAKAAARGMGSPRRR